MEIMPCSELLMVVEDDPLNLKTIEKILTDAGYRVHPAQNGRQCLEDVTTVRPDLVLMDINMPDLNGIETCRRLKSGMATRNLPVIFVTGSSDDHHLESAFSAGGCDFVRKPIGRIELLARVRSALIQHQAALRMAEGEKLKGALETAGGVCHELNQPLQYILGAVQLLMLDVPEEAPMFRNLDDIRARVEQMGQITRKLSEITHYRTREYAGGHQIIDLRQAPNGPDVWPPVDDPAAL